MLRNVLKLFSLSLSRIIFKRPARILAETKTSRFPKTLVTLANGGAVVLTNQEPELTNQDPGLTVLEPVLSNQEPGLTNEEAGLANEEPEVVDFDAEVLKAAEAGRLALADLLNILKDQFLSVSAQYQNCLDQRVTIMRDGADNIDDVLEEFKTMSEDLKVELDNLLIVANTVGRMLQLEAQKHLPSNKEFAKLIKKRTKELDDLLNQEAKKMKKVEKNVLDMQKKFDKQAQM